MRSIAGIDVGYQLGRDAELFRRALDALPCAEVHGPRIEIRRIDRPPLERQPASNVFFGDLRYSVSRNGVRLTSVEIDARISDDGSSIELWSEHARPRDLERAGTLALAVALEAHGAFHLHAAASTIDGHTVLIPGGSGSGKTTTLLMLVEAGAQWSTDDAVFLRGADAYGWPRPVHVAEQTLEVLPRLVQYAGDPFGEGVLKRAVDLASIRPSSVARGALVPSAILVPSVERSHPQTTLLPLPTDEALAALLGSSTLSLVSPRPEKNEHVRHLAALASSLPCARLMLAPDALEHRELVPKIVSSWLRIR